MLVEGGPAHRRINRVLAILVGVVIGGGFGLAFVGYSALHAAHDAHEAINEVKASRVVAAETSCVEANERHVTASVGLAALAARTSPKNPTLAQAKARKVVLDAFVNALAPSYDCKARVKQLTRP